jgi:hypothetical protein
MSSSTWRSSISRRAATRLFVAALLAGGCDASAVRPAGPTLTRPTPTPSEPGTGETYWSLTTTLTAVTGANTCSDWRPAIGTATSWLLTVRRSAGGAIWLQYDDNNPVSGTTDGASFTASATSPGFQPCGGVPADYQFESRVTGTFSADGNAVTAQETWTYRFASGDAIVFRLDWAATLRMK